MYRDAEIVHDLESAVVIGFIQKLEEDIVLSDSFELWEMSRIYL